VEARAFFLLGLTLVFSPRVRHTAERGKQLPKPTAPHTATMQAALTRARPAAALRPAAAPRSAARAPVRASAADAGAADSDSDIDPLYMVAADDSANTRRRAAGGRGGGGRGAGAGRGGGGRGAGRRRDEGPAEPELTERVVQVRGSGRERIGRRGEEGGVLRCPASCVSAVTASAWHTMCTAVGRRGAVQCAGEGENAAPSAKTAAVTSGKPKTSPSRPLPSPPHKPRRSPASPRSSRAASSCLSGRSSSSAMRRARCVGWLGGEANQARARKDGAAPSRACVWLSGWRRMRRPPGPG
jgi:hypothetical protein